MEPFKCPYCDTTFPLIYTTYRHWHPSFDASDNQSYNSTYPTQISLRFYLCPSCKRLSIKASSAGSETGSFNTNLLPNSFATQFPDYVPESIRNDYSEACAIVNLSPKASATLSRRCLQSLIRDFWGIKKNTLYQEITELQNHVSAEQWKVLNALRNLGNIGAHPEADANLIIDIDPDDAVKIIKVIELLIKQWYVERHEQQKLYSEVTSLSDEKCSQKSNPK